MTTVELTDRERTDRERTDRERIDRERTGQLFAGSSESVRWRWFWLALLAMCVPMLVPHFAGMWAQEHYQYFPFVFAVVGYLLYDRWDRVFRAPRGWLGWGLIAIGLVSLVGSVLAPSSWLGGFAFVLFSLACLDSMSGERDRRLLIAGLPLLMLVQLPLRLDRSVIVRLQKATTELSSVVLDVATVPHAVSGNVIQLASRELFVAEACSGIQSVFTLAFLACVIVAWNRRRLWLTPLYLLIAVLLAVAGNVFRVTTIAVASAWWDADLASGWQHDTIGYVALVLAGLLLLSFDQLVVTLLHPTSVGSGEMAYNPLIRGWNYVVAGWRYTGEETGYGYQPKMEHDEVRRSKDPWLERLVLGGRGPIRVARYTLLAFAGVITLAAVAQAMRVEIGRDWAPLVSSDLLIHPTADLIEGEYGVMRVKGHQAVRDGTEPRLGQNADLWEFQAGQQSGQLVLSQTYRGWHELCVCYEIMDWELLEREVCELDPEMVATDETDSFVTARFKQADGQYGYLLFSAVNADGTIPEAPTTWGALGSQFLDRLERHGVIKQQNLAMLQLWMVTPDKVPSEFLRDVQTDFVAIRNRIATAIAAGEPLSPNPQLAADETTE